LYKIAVGLPNGGCIDGDFASSLRDQIELPRAWQSLRALFWTKLA